MQQNKHELWELRQMQSLPLESKITMTKHRIQSWVDEFGIDGVYVSFSGAITGTDDFCERFAEAEDNLSCEGLSIVNPAKLNNIMPKDATYDEYMKMSFKLLGMCDAIYMLKGWEESKGANREYGFAVAKGMKIMFEK